MTTPTASTPAPSSVAGGVTVSLRDRLQQFLAFASLLVIFIVFAVASPNFLTYGNVLAILYSTVVIGTLALSVRRSSSSPAAST
ncbi:MAG: ribose transport system permease protein [Kribbellaceae bacterium]|nr:ribose transport system permease protein [Kribbellaceae bacterium]